MSQETNITKKLKLSIESVKLIVFDFDGVFTDNRVIVSQDGTESVSCCRSDGLGLRRLDEIGIKYCIISTETNPVVATRAKKLNVPVFQGHDDKLPVLMKLAQNKGLELHNIAYVGNDINDKECLESVGLPIVVADAYPEIVSISMFQTKQNGGYGAVREVCDLFYSVVLNLYPEGADSADYYFSGTYLISGNSISVPTDGIIEATFDATLTGALTRGTV